MEGVPPSCNEDDVNLTSNQFDFQSPEDSFNISEFLSSPPEVSGNQSSILCNDQDEQNMVVDNNVINDSLQQTTLFPPSFPQTMVSRYQLNPNLFDPQCVNPMLPGPSMPLRDQQWTTYPLPMSNQVPAMLPGPQPPINQWHQNSNIPEPHPGHGYMTPNATTSQHGGFNQSGPSFPAPRYLPHPNLSDPRCANPMLPGPSMPLRDQQWTNYQLPMRNQVPAMLPGPQPPLNQWHQYSNIHQPQPGHGYMTPNVTTSEHGGFIQPGPSFPAPRSQYFSNQGQVDRAAVIPNIDNVQQENFVPRSQMDNLQVRGLQNQTATPNASNPGLGTSLQSQNRGLNTQQVRSITELSSSFSLL
ncbi:hypothetical protein POTOM_058886 [Populus tomentosa]|uniref:Uncharacterized protein n=1 Tax=Populus tomentosa TaxID=118781 RepID=A0A8X8BZH3_POPTO|nr:hypothetical protein POTOM_058875 [Populus tomentosa]KAG6737370.1 hypothetical protein POTOM_058886 [Populus tomentosa]